MQQKPLLADLFLDELSALLQPCEFKKFEAKIVYEWLNKGASVSEMSSLSLPKRQLLADNFVIEAAHAIKTLEDADGTKKFLFSLFDGNVVECVLMSHNYGNTICVSTQVGCRQGCVFCASTLGGLVRNLSAGEILYQIIAVNKLLGGGLGKMRKITNVVLMGSGEPLDNYDNVIKFLRLVSAAGGLNISPRNISLSTCGLIEQINRLAGENLPVNLTISLHAPTQEAREKIIPAARFNPLPALIAAAKDFFSKTGRRVIFEYTLIDGKNDSVDDAKRLAALVANFPTHINLIRLNPVAERRENRPSSMARTKEFLAALEKLGASATLRRSLGKEIDGACGQLRRKFVGDKKG